ncbi:hypothetical protein F5884DRAFT_832638 [Xylogone sp. PMI_703]|nr:hypothetical protein F5884DRAFT_832638 [Xylogone sp. PMI_703]
MSKLRTTQFYRVVYAVYSTLIGHASVNAKVTTSLLWLQCIMYLRHTIYNKLLKGGRQILLPQPKCSHQSGHITIPKRKLCPPKYKRLCLTLIRNSSLHASSSSNLPLPYSSARNASCLAQEESYARTLHLAYSQEGFVGKAIMIYDLIRDHDPVYLPLDITRRVLISHYCDSEIIVLYGYDRQLWYTLSRDSPLVETTYTVHGRDKTCSLYYVDDITLQRDRIYV